MYVYVSIIVCKDPPTGYLFLNALTLRLNEQLAASASGLAANHATANQPSSTDQVMINPCLETGSIELSVSMKTYIIT